MVIKRLRIWKCATTELIRARCRECLLGGRRLDKHIHTDSGALLLTLFLTKLLFLGTQRAANPSIHHHSVRQITSDVHCRS